MHVHDGEREQEERHENQEGELAAKRPIPSSHQDEARGNAWKLEVDRNEKPWQLAHKCLTEWATLGGVPCGGMSCRTERLPVDLPRPVARMLVVCRGAANHPLVTSPDIDYEFHFWLGFGLNQIEYTINICHDPAFEAYLNGRTVYAQLPIDPTPWYLFEICGHDIIPPIIGVLR